MVIYLDLRTVTIQSSSDRVDLLNLYNPSRNVTVVEFEHYFRQLAKIKLVVGYLNAHSHLWDSHSMAKALGIVLQIS